MESERKNKLICQFCQTEYSSTSTRNRHLRKFHPESMDSMGQKQTIKRIICPMCLNEENKFSYHNDLIKHLTVIHGVDIKKSILNFRNVEEFTAWRAQENREVDYACHRRNKCRNGDEHIFYNCNRSNSKGFISSCNKRSMKSGGSIRICGTCPSRICVKISTNVMVTFVETHVGHADELRTKRLSKAEQNIIVGQLSAGVTNNRIIQDARKMNNNKLKRINLTTRGDLAYLIRKYNIDKKRHADDMTATALKIEEWNRQGKNNAFLFKKIGESYPGLKDEDFAVGYMNGVMEKKLRDFGRIICVDGTHGTNRRNWDLTIVLIKDENNMGFPVAFLLSNRLDQTIQEIFFRALRSRLGETIQAEYIMSDDDPKYYNAWTQVMSSDRKPRRLLCQWHVIKNWNIQGRSKIKKAEIRQEMKKEMRKILKETNATKFTALKDNYFGHLEEEEEYDFLKYLQKYYFQSEERIMMWAHCHKINAGININMAIESLNKVLKYNKMSGQRNLRIEKLLDLLDELVDEKMWKRIVNDERPNENNYQHKIALEAHKKAEQMNGKVELSEFGKFKVQSCSVSDKYYFVSYNEVCDEECRTEYCYKCKICVHRYQCQCPEYAVKTVLCKHIHAVALFGERSESVSGSLYSGESNILYINKPMTSQLHYQEDISHFIQGNFSRQHHNTSINFEERREIALEELCSFGRSLDENSFDKFMAEFKRFKNYLEQDSERMYKKVKIETET